MLDGLEGKLAAVIGDSVVARAHLSVGTVPATPAAGQGVVQVAVSEVGPEPSRRFEPGRVARGGTDAAPTSRAVLPLQFVATVAFRMRPADATPGAAAAARGTLLRDVSAVAHALDADAVRAGAAFTVAGDPGFSVQGFVLDGGGTEVAPVDGLLAAALRYRGQADIWPPGAPGPEGVIAAVDTAVVAQPVLHSVGDLVVAPGGVTTVRIPQVAGRRAVGLDADGEVDERARPRLAVTVLSDLPMAARGRITSGAAGTETGVRIVAQTEPETVVEYRAPDDGPGRPPAEQVTVSLATPAGGRGTLVARADVALAPSG